MPRQSTRSKVLRDLFFLYVASADEVFDMSISHRRSPVDPSKATPFHRMCIENLDDITLLVQTVLSNQYFRPCAAPFPHKEFDLGALFDMPSNDFKQIVRISKRGFIFLLNEITCNPIFISTNSGPLRYTTLHGQ